LCWPYGGATTKRSFPRARRPINATFPTPRSTFSMRATSRSRHTLAKSRLTSGNSLNDGSSDDVRALRLLSKPQPPFGLRRALPTVSMTISPPIFHPPRPPHDQRNDPQSTHRPTSVAREFRPHSDRLPADSGILNPLDAARRTRLQY